ncbi:MAG TPA: TetR/AcrR family transcriptional regulator, partial [Candidatus Saccharimonadaceae bacterium]|nr:TetR/AcrR family transcriptional regulator [Candidatus Saccharimonadaceae bacterium]
MATKKSIIDATIHCLAFKGYDGASIRDVAAKAGVQASRIYYYFADKSELFEAAYRQIIANLQRDIVPIRRIDNPSERMRAIIDYQLRQRKMLAALLNYFVGQSNKFPKRSDDGYVPPSAYMHIFECLKIGETAGLYQTHTTSLDAKIIAHIMNGFILEYATRPLPKPRREQLVEAITS